MPKIFRRQHLQVYTLLSAICLMFALQEILIPGSLSVGQVALISRQASALGIIALGQAIVILTGGIDLSVSGTVMLINVLAVSWMGGSDTMFWPMLVLCLLLGAGIGLVNGLGVLVLRIAPFMMTLCSMTIMQGVCYVYTKGSPTGSAAPLLRSLGTGYLFGIIPYATVIWLLLGCALFIVLQYTRLGRGFYAVGGNARAARLSGISTFRMQLLAYIISGVYATIAGLLMTGYINTTSLTIGADYTMNSLAAVLIGGNAIEGGRGGVWGVVLGALFIMLLFAILTMLSIGVVGKSITQGLIIFAVVASQGLFRKTNRGGIV